MKSPFGSQVQVVQAQGHAEVAELEHAVLREEDVLRLQVPVHDAAAVQKQQPEGDAGSANSGCFS